jgi:hypothetical protein
MTVVSVTFEYLFSGGARTLVVCLSYPVLSDYRVGASLHNAEDLMISVRAEELWPPISHQQRQPFRRGG